MRNSWSQGRINHLELYSSFRPFNCHKPELSNIISKKVIHNYLAIISIEIILSGIHIKDIVTSYIWNIKGVFLFDPWFDELFLVSLFVKGVSGGEYKHKEKHPPTLLGWIINGFLATSSLHKIWVFFIKYYI